jgi:ligand-binding sensor domain-containing protein
MGRSGEVAYQHVLISDNVRSIAADRRNIWVGTDKGVSRYIKSEGRWVHYTMTDGLSNDGVNAIAVDGDYVWFATDEGVTRYDISRDQWRIFRSKDGLASDKVLCVAVDGDYVWFGTDKGLNRYDKRIDSWAVRTKKDGLPSNNITTIAVDQDYIWVGTGKEEMRRGRIFWEPREGKPGMGGVSRYHRGTDSWNNYSTKDGLVGEEISVIAVDEDVVWFGTKGFGVSVFSKTDQAFVKTYTKTDLLVSDMIRAIVVDGNQVWFGTANGGVQRYIKSVNTWINYTTRDGLSSNHITCIAVDGDEIWFGTYQSGVTKFNKVTGKWTIYTLADQIADNDVREIAWDEKGEMWIATPSGLSVFDPTDGSWRIYNRKDGLVSEYITAVKATGEEVWVGTERGVGVLNRRDGRWRFYREIGGVEDSYVNCVVEIDGRIWVGMEDGLALHDRSSGWKRIEQLKGKSISSLSYDGQNLWIGAGDGLYRLEITTGKLEGLMERKVNVVLASDKGLLAGTMEGVYLVKDQELKRLSPSLTVTALYLEGTRLWIGTPTGLRRYDLDSGDLRSLAGKIPYSVRDIHLIEGMLYLATDAGLIRYDPATDRIEAYRSITDKNPLLGLGLSNIEFDGDYIWMSNWEGTINGCILRYHRPTDTWRRFTRFDIFKSPKVKAMSEIRRIVVDGGSVWFATDAGLLRYDKPTDSWSRYTVEDGLISNYIDLIVPGAEEVWVSYSNIGFITRIDKATWRCESFDLSSNLPWDNVSSIAFDGDDVWAGTRMALYRYNRETKSWRKYTVRDGLGANGVNWIAADDRYIWVAATRWGEGKPLSRYDKMTGRWETFSPADVLASNDIDRILVTPERVWIIYEFFEEAGITEYDRRNDEWITITPKGEWGSGVTELCEDGDYLWLGTIRNGLMRFHIASGTWTTFDRNNGLLHDHINERALKVDERYVWVGTPLGLSRFDKKLESWIQFTPRKALLGREVRAIAIDERYVWVGTTSGLSRYDKLHGTWENYRQRGGRQEMRLGRGRWSWWEPPSEEGLVNNWVSSLAVDDRYVWIGTREGANRYDKIADKWDRYKRENGLPDEDITSIAISGNDIWVGTNRGIGKFPRTSDNPNAWVSYTSGIEIKPGVVSKEFAETLVSDEVWAIAVDKKYVWVGTRMGVSRYDKRKDLWKTFTKEDGLPDDKITCIATDNRKVWFGSDNGVAVYDMESMDWRSYSKEDGLASNKVTCIALDGDLVWFGTYDSGVSVLNLKENTWKTYTKDEGLVHNSIYSIAVEDDYVWIGTQRGLSRFSKSTGVWTTFTETHWPEDIR